MKSFFRAVVDDNRFMPDDVPAFAAKLFFEGDKRRVQRERFAVLLILSTVIATYGVIGDSTATVIGAMIIAPLMTPIMATAAALVMGNMQRAGRSVVVVVSGVFAVIATSWFIGAFLNLAVISFDANSQIISRVSPNLTDLMVALASGAAGAFAMSRDDVADTLPGVAISIALVPPLAVVGLALSGGRWDDAQGALLLFMTNFFSILLAGGGTLALLGLSSATLQVLATKARRRTFRYIAFGTIIIAIPLAATSINVGLETMAEWNAYQTAEAWLAGSEYEVIGIHVDGKTVQVVIDGEGDLPPMAALQAEVDEEVLINLKVLYSRNLTLGDLETETAE